jgi:hypothetical protein
MAGAQRESKFTKAKTTLRLPDLEQSKRASLELARCRELSILARSRD